MSATYAQYVGDGTNRNFAVSFPFLSRDHVQVTLNATSAATFSWLNDSLIQLTPAPAAGVLVDVRRVTPRGTPVDFEDGSVLAESDLDLLAVYTAYLAEEALSASDDSLKKDLLGNFNAGGLRITNTGTATAPSDVVSLGQMRGEFMGATAAAAQSAADADADRIAAQAAASESRDIIGTLGDLSDALSAARTLDQYAEKTAPIIPKTGELYVFGDSQSACINNGVGLDYTENGYLKIPYRWPNQIASRHDRTLTVQNHAIGSSRMGWVPGTPGTNYPLLGSHFNRTGLLPYNWQGAIAAMPGWNSIGPQNDGSTAFYTAMRRAHEALIARFLLTDWFGINHLGWNRQNGAAGATYQWVTNCDASNLGPQIDGAGIYTNPFYYGDASGARYTLDMTVGKFVQFGNALKRDVALFFDTSPTTDECAARVTVNDNVVDEFRTDYLGPAPFNADTLPRVVFLKDVPPGATIRVETTKGVVRWLAAGVATPETGGASKRTILYGTATGNTANGRTRDHLYACAKQTEAAVAAFAGRYPVYLVNNLGNWNDTTDQEPTDISHLTPHANEVVHQNFIQAYKPSGGLSPNVVSIPDFMGRSVQVDGTLDVQKNWTLSFLYARFRDLFGNALAVLGKVDESGASSNDLNIRAFARVLLSAGNTWDPGVVVASNYVGIRKPLVIGSGVVGGAYAQTAAKYTAAAVVAFGPIASGSFAEQSMDVVGAVVGSIATVDALGTFIEPGFFLKAACVEAGKVRIRCENRNVSGTGTPANIPLRVTVWQEV